MLTFPYVRKGDQYFPVVDLTFVTSRTSLTVKALVDSGASFSVFRAELLECMGIALSNGQRLFLEGIGGRILGYLHRLPVQVGTVRFLLAVVFSEELTVSFNLLGRANFFQQFLITFDERRRLVRLGHYARMGKPGQSLRFRHNDWRIRPWLHPVGRRERAPACAALVTMDGGTAGRRESHSRRYRRSHCRWRGSYDTLTLNTA